MSTGSAWRALDLGVALAAGLTLGLLLAALIRHQPTTTDPTESEAP